MFCKNCGAQVADTTKFCQHCGISVATTSAAASTSTPTGVGTSTPSYDLDPYELHDLDNFKFVLTKKYAEFKGRASRSEYFRFSLMMAIVSCADAS